MHRNDIESSRRLTPRHRFNHILLALVLVVYTLAARNATAQEKPPGKLGGFLKKLKTNVVNVSVLVGTNVAKGVQIAATNVASHVNRTPHNPVDAPNVSTPNVGALPLSSLLTMNGKPFLTPSSWGQVALITNRTSAGSSVVLHIKDPLKVLVAPAPLGFLNAQPTAPSEHGGPNMSALGQNEAANYAQLSNAPAKDKVLHFYRLALWEMRRGNHAKARTLFEDALKEVDTRFGENKDAARARGYFKAEKEKPFVGESYERVMANVYLGFLSLMEGATNVARACFKNAEWEDSWEAADAEKQQYQGDIVSAYYLRGVVSESPDTEAMYGAATNSCTIFSPPPAYDRAHNVLLLIDYGTGPQKYTDGKHNRELHYRDGQTSIARVRLSVGTSVITAGPYDDLTFQAITRGGRVMDHILKEKSQLKDAAQVGGWTAALAGAGVAAAGADQRAALGLMLGSYVLQTVSERGKAEADTRCWDNLPQCVTFATMQLPPGRHSIRCEFLDGSDQPQPRLSRVFAVNVLKGKLNTAYVSEHSDQQIIHAAQK